MSEQPKGDRREKEPSPPTTNNFYANLPGGGYRGREDKAKLHEAIDQLLQSEFADFDVGQCLEGINRGDELFSQYHKDGYSDKELLKQIKQQTQETEGRLRPLFERLHDMGFSYGELMQ